MLDFGIGGVGVEAGRLLAENGADVIKIETRAHPDFIRAIYGTEMNPAFASSSRCKRSLGINLRTDRGRDIIMRLAADTDIVIENSATGTMEKYGLGFEQLREINPRIILAVESDDGRERSVERLDRFRPQLPHRDRHDLPLELPRRRDAAGLRRHSSRSHGGQDAGSGSRRDALRAAIAAPPVATSKWRRPKRSSACSPI